MPAPRAIDLSGRVRLFNGCHAVHAVGSPRATSGGLRVRYETVRLASGPKPIRQPARPAHCVHLEEVVGHSRDRVVPQHMSLGGVPQTRTQRRLAANAPEDPSQAGRTWVLLTEAAEGGWGIAGTAFGREEFAKLAG